MISNEELLRNFASVTQRIDSRATLVAVSKTKPASLVQVLYDAGQRDFGENYVQELTEKAQLLAATCPEIRWHFIGHLQSNKVKQLVRETPRLVCVETIDSSKLAQKLNAAFASQEAQCDVYVQVNTSGEASKSGVAPDDESVETLVRHVREQCPQLRFAGLMTIGERGDTTGDFEALCAVRTRLCAALGIADERSVGLSMGMSSDFEQAIEHGSTTVRIGSTLFGVRH